MISITSPGGSFSTKPLSAKLTPIGSPYTNAVGQVVVPMQWDMSVVLGQTPGGEAKLFKASGNLEAPVQTLVWAQSPETYASEISAMLEECTGISGLEGVQITSQPN